ncbi:LeoA/HP0731 family dynamin-like GTPase, partial [Aeromonas veronii]|uniref:LeoA/HP0731 family dynamin-like GTPase n=1 Tax=Aeromonas veronii TaxID=654 RepID=UPI0030073D4F
HVEPPAFKIRENSTYEHLSFSGGLPGHETLIRKTGVDVVRDVLGKKISTAKDELIKFELLAANQRRDSARIQEDIDEGKRKVLATVGGLYEELSNLEKDLLNNIRTLPRDQVRAFLEAEIGFTQGESVNILLNFREFLQASCEHSVQIV